MTDTNAPQAGQPPFHAKRRTRAALAAALLAAFAVGAGATAIAKRGPTMTYIALTPAPIAAMKDNSSIAIEGDIAEIFGNKFVVRDASGRALVETGPRGEDRDLVAKDEKVIVQGRFDHGFVHAIAIRHADGRTDTLDPPPPHHPGHDGPPDRDGPLQDPART